MSIMHRMGTMSAAVALALSSAAFMACSQDTPSVMPPAAQEPATPPAAEQGARSSMIEGELVRLDTDAKLIVVKTAAGFDQQLRYTDQTFVNGANRGIAGLAGTAGTRVSVRVTGEGTDRVATEITVHPR
jgi:hypothetical protein